MDKAEIRNALVNWQMGLLINQEQGCKENKVVSTNPVPQQVNNLQLVSVCVKHRS